MLLVKKDNFELNSASRLVKAEDVAVAKDANDIISAAEAEAARIAEEARKAYEEERRKGYEKGLEEGRAAVVAGQLDRQAESAAFMESMENKMVDVVMKAMQKCIAEIGDKELVVQIVRKVMHAVVRNQRHITLKVGPEMVPVVRERMNEIMADYPLLDEVDVLEDARQKGASCIIETEAGIAEASVETQLAAIEKSLKKHFAREK